MGPPVGQWKTFHKIKAVDGGEDLPLGGDGITRSLNCRPSVLSGTILKMEGRSDLFLGPLCRHP